MDTTGFRLPRVLLPRPDLDLFKWAVVACDQYTSEPDYWHRVERDVGDAPSTLQLIFPEVFLGAADAPARIERIQQAMRRCLAEGLLVEHEGAILVERTLSARTRRGLMLELDLEHYDFRPGSTSLIRPTEGTIVERLAPRIEVRSGAELELPHILVLIDDPQQTVIEPIAAAQGQHHAVGLIGPGLRFTLVEIADPLSTLAVATAQPVVDRLIEQGGASHVDYVHGDDVLERLAMQEGCVGIHLAPIGKRELLRMVVRQGPLPRKTFSMGEAHEKRFYIEARRIRG